MRSSASLLLLALASTAAFAAPSIGIQPYNAARFAVGQKFDLRVEFTGLSGFVDAKFSIDGTPATVATTSDTATGRSYTLRARSYSSAGTHTVRASVTDGTGTVTKESTFSVLDLSGSRRRIKNVIIFLGDGMGAAHRTAARLVKYGLTNGNPNGALAMDLLPGTGMVSTHSLNSFITDSSPGMAGYVTGSHSNNNQEGVFPDNTATPWDNPRVEYLAAYMHRMYGTSLGIVSTADLEDATPAANMVHTADRNAGTGICNQYYLEQNRTGLSVLLGGGRRWFLPPSEFGSARTDATNYASLPADLASGWGVPATGVATNTDLLGLFTSNGWKYSADASTLATQAASSNKLLGLFSYGNMNVAYDKVAYRRAARGETPTVNAKVTTDFHAPNQPMLEEMTDAALTVLKRNRNGFVLMVEGASIDKQSHLMDADRAIWDTIEFDNAIARARAFADANPDTLVIVTADHECSGFSLNGALTSLSAAQTPYSTDAQRQNLVGSALAIPGLNATDGYPAQYDYTGKLLVGFGANADRYETFLSKALPFADNFGSELGAKGYPADIRVRDMGAGYKILGQIAATNTQAAHTGTDIPCYFYTSGSTAWQGFVGSQQNVDVFFKLVRAAQGGY